jgi:hypothetical protein
MTCFDEEDADPRSLNGDEVWYEVQDPSWRQSIDDILQDVHPSRHALRKGDDVVLLLEHCHFEFHEAETEGDSIVSQYSARGRLEDSWCYFERSGMGCHTSTAPAP